MAKNRLSPKDWITAGVTALTAKGPSFLRAETLARDLGTTKGSFYWHFKDVPTYHEALLLAWETHAQTKLTALRELGAKPVTKLRLIAEINAESGTGLSTSGTEAALRAWAEENELARETLQRIDAQRLSLIQDLLADIELTNKELAHLIYAAHLGLSELSKHQADVTGQSLMTLVDLILALYEDA
ncbi:MAG: TetR/AcrR family transcriptional regulator [Cognatishimia sp.]|uniref:TetR/AcrR family transcriptional regulator n=1 Tax=Cognatishimia sp. TaxID=2211648 RepID=UPI0040586FFB